MRWLAGCSAEGLREALHAVAPELSTCDVPVPEPAVPFLPEVVASSTDPLLLVTRRVPGASLFDVVGSIDLDRAARQLASFLAALHRPASRERAEAAVGPLTGIEIPSAATSVLREWFGTRVRPEQYQLVLRWCDWADAVLALPAPAAVLVHGDLHGDNQVWQDDELRLVVDFETIGAVSRAGHGLARAHRPRRRGVAHRSRHPAGGPQDTARLDR